MADKKPGFFKRLFKFGKSAKTEEDEAAAVAEAESEAAAALAREEAEKQRLTDEVERAEAEKQLAAKEAAREAERLEQQAVEKAAQEAAKLERAEKQKQEAETAEQERLAQEAADAAKAEAEAEEKRVEEVRFEQERVEKQKQEADQIEQEQLAQQAAAAADAAKAEAEAKRVEEERLEQEGAEKQKQEAERGEQERLAAEAEAVAKAETEAKRVEEQRLEQERLDAEAKAELSVPEPEPEPEPEPAKKSWFSKLRAGLSRSSSQLSENITSVFTKRKLDDDTLQDLEDILIQADMGVETAMNITDALASQRMGKDITGEEVREFMAAEVEKVLEPVASELELDLDHTPHVMLVVGVNGSGKTTTIGKLSQKLYDAGFSTLLVAGDTFRAAAIEQLNIWGSRTQSPVVSRPLGSDAAGLAYDAYTQAVEEGRDVMLMDTAGRLQNKTELMDELEKIIRVLRKQDPTAPHTVLLTLDATTGQNALNQVEIFKDVAGVNGLVMTKLDGTARGGIMVAIAAKFKLPVYFIGVGEQVDDLEPFEAKDFARSIAGLDN